jgi:hypothetical protein
MTTQIVKELELSPYSRRINKIENEIRNLEKLKRKYLSKK